MIAFSSRGSKKAAAAVMQAPRTTGDDSDDEEAARRRQGQMTLAVPLLVMPVSLLQQMFSRVIATGARPFGGAAVDGANTLHNHALQLSFSVAMDMLSRPL